MTCVVIAINVRSYRDKRPTPQKKLTEEVSGETVVIHFVGLGALSVGGVPEGGNDSKCAFTWRTNSSWSASFPHRDSSENSSIWALDQSPRNCRSEFNLTMAKLDFCLEYGLLPRVPSERQEVFLYEASMGFLTFCASF